MATNLLEKLDRKPRKVSFSEDMSLGSFVEGKSPLEAFSFQAIAMNKLRRLRPRLDGENLSLMVINHDDLVVAIEALYAALEQKISADVPSNDIHGQVIRHIHKTTKAKNWMPIQIGDTSFSASVCRDKSEGMLLENNASTQIGGYRLFDAVIEIRNMATGGCMWYVTVERCGGELRRALGEFLVYAPEDKDLVDEFVEFSYSLLRDARQDGRANKIIQYLNTNMSITMSDCQGWSNIFMTEEVTKNLHDDFIFFLKNEKWFRDNNLPFKRGYLLTGLPGNGKTSAIRVMASTPGFRAFSFDFQSQQNNDNENLYRAFERARQNAPSIFILEDVDRIFEEGQSHIRVTKDAILNCLDGLGDRDGVIVVATANHPELLDEAILKRPGRFDRIVKFAPPDTTMRYSMLFSLFNANVSNTMDEETLTWLVTESDGYSMASVKEIFIASASLAFQDGSLTVTADHAREAISAIRKQYAKPAARNIGLR